MRTGTLLLLTFATGIVDAATFLGLGQVFAAMQTGNVIFLGVGVAGSDGAPVAAPLVALAAFLVGGLVAAALVTRRLASALALAVEVGLLVAAAMLVAVASPTVGDPAAVAAVALVAVAMGLRNTAVRAVGGQNLATTVLNLTVVGIAAGDAAVAGRGDLAQRALALGTILAGAATGALLCEVDAAAALAAAAAVSLAALVTLRARPAVAPST